jgi:hypothetical protein
LGCEIDKIDVHKDRYVVGITSETLLVGDLASGKFSEVSLDCSQYSFYFMFRFHGSVEVTRNSTLNMIIFVLFSMLEN